MHQEDLDTGEFIPGWWTNDSPRESFLDLKPSSSRNSTRVTKEIREEFTSWFNTEGDVAWQRKMCGLWGILIWTHTFWYIHTCLVEKMEKKNGKNGKNGKNLFNVNATGSRILVNIFFIMTQPKWQYTIKTQWRSKKLHS